MKKEIHPTYHNKAKVKCACGNEFEVGSVLEKIDVEICGACHPFYTGEEKIIDTGGRVERFKKRMAGVKPVKAKASKVAKKEKTEKVEKPEKKEKEVEVKAEVEEKKEETQKAEK